MKKKFAIGSVALAVASIALGACVVANNANCPGGTSNYCPDGENATGATCTTTDKVASNTESARGYNPVSSTGQCTYDCQYPQGTNSVFCGSYTNTWNGYKPGSVTCPSTS